MKTRIKLRILVVILVMACVIVFCIRRYGDGTTEQKAISETKEICISKPPVINAPPKSIISTEVPKKEMESYPTEHWQKVLDVIDIPWAGGWESSLAEFEIRFTGIKGNAGILPDLCSVDGSELYKQLLSELTNTMPDEKTVSEVQRCAISKIVANIDNLLIAEFLKATELCVKPSQIVEDGTEELAGGIQAIAFRYGGHAKNGIPHRFRIMLTPLEQNNEEILKEAFVKNCARRIELELAREYITKSSTTQYLPAKQLNAFLDNPSQRNLALLLRSQTVIEICVPSLQVESLLDQILRLRKTGILVRNTVGSQSNIGSSASNWNAVIAKLEMAGNQVSNKDVYDIQNYYRTNPVGGLCGEQVTIGKTGEIENVMILDIAWDCDNRFLLSNYEQAAGPDEKTKVFRTFCDGYWLYVREADGKQHKVRMPVTMNQHDETDVGIVLSQCLEKVFHSKYISESGIRYGVFVFKMPVEETSTTVRFVSYYIRLDNNQLVQVKEIQPNEDGLVMKIMKIDSLYGKVAAEKK